MRVSRVLLAVAAGLLVCSSAHAQDTVDPCAQYERAAAQAPELVQLERDGHPGVWLSSEAFRHASCLLRFHTAALLVLRLDEEAEQLRDEQVSLLREQLSLAVQARDVLGGVLEEAERRAREAEEDADSVLSSPALWFGIGAITVVLVGLGARYVL